MKKREWGAAAFLFVVLAGVLAFALTVGLPPKPKPPAPAAAQPGQAAQPATPEAFFSYLGQHPPKYSPLQRLCPIDGTRFEVPTQSADNRAGGVATDMMKIALAPNPEGQGPPDLSQQDFLLLWGTCPKCGATFGEIDLVNLISEPFLSRLKKWNIAKAAPPLARVPQEKWTTDERVLVRYLTQRQAGVEPVELGFTALTGAYAANLAVYLGRDYRVPSPAFYALAAAEFRGALAQGNLSKEATGVTAMTLGETERLLGRFDEAKGAFAQARAAGALDEGTLAILGQLEGLSAAKDFNLARAERKDAKPPPIGWYLDSLLPAINGHITQYRSAWTAPASPEELIARIFALLP